MANQVKKNTITFSNKTVRQQGGMVILPLKEYQKLYERATPVYYLEGKEAKKLDKLVEEGLREYKKGKCKEIKSLTELD